ncbi:hypothetical protein DFJ58DRAFT_483802 [Suillus subalutaceus]|uniref:uncharacterized protein n=1 Tax=Suillus subalutaceus TaxID=48586 RepID=UPI001B8870C1|nr:uncharacterized protein DFJ58DRAFT_483802 [Suillus subalutaceus]KAG1847347.1 hypothetical protein DFJ58DRAFT_483802 [Suillus subalutaceus]
MMTWVSEYLTSLQLLFTMTKRKSSSDSTQQTHTSKDGHSAKKLRISRSKDSGSRSPLPPNVNHEGASSTSAAPSPMEVTNTQSELRGAQEFPMRMHPLAGPVITVASVGQGGEENLDAVDSFQDTYLEPLRILDNVISKIADVWICLSIVTELISSHSYIHMQRWH